jgi:alanine dehydrogenase
MLFLKETPIETVISMKAAIDAVEEALAEVAMGKAVLLPRRRIHHDNEMLFGLLPGSLKGVMGAYLQTDQRRTLHHETVILYSVETGEPLILFQDCAINELRTGAGGGVGAKYLARKNSTQVGVLGSSSHAMAQLQGVCAVREVQHVRVFSPNVEHRLRFADRARRELHVDVEAVQSADSAMAADILVTATNARAPVFDGALIRPGTHITSIANGDRTRVRNEIDDTTMRRASRVVVTSKETVRTNGSDIFRAAEKGVLAWEEVYELGDLILGKVPGRTSEDQVTLYKLQGTGIMDLAVGLRAYEALKDSQRVQRL